MTSASQRRVDRALRRLADSVLVGESGLDGCAASRIDSLEKRYDVTLPEVYRRFLSELGESAGEFLPGDDLCCSDVIDLTDEVREWLDGSDVAATITDSEFVFVGHHDYVYLYFDTADGPDPPVYRYVAGDDTSEQVFESFSAWVESTVEDEIVLAGT